MSKMDDKPPFSKSSRLIYTWFLFAYISIVLLLSVWQIILLVCFFEIADVFLLNVPYLESKYGAFYWAPFLNLFIVVVIMGGVYLLNYKYEILPPNTGYRYSKKNPLSLRGQVKIDRNFYGLSGIFLIMSLTLVIIREIGLSIIYRFHLPTELIRFFVFLFFLSFVLYHVVSIRFSNRDK